MKKVSSAALLALKLTWKAALLIFAVTGIVQAIAVFRELMPGGVPLQATFGFETLMDSALSFSGRFWAVFLLAGLVMSAASTKGSRSVYTMNRLGLREMQVTFVFGGVFSLYFLLFWAFQLGLVYGVFAWYSRFSLVNSNAFMLAAWRSEWLHLLLPLGEWMGYVRNVAVCISFGFTAAFGVHRMRHGRNALICAVPPILCAFMLSGRIANHLELTLSILLIAYTVGAYFLTRGGDEDEIL